VNTPGSTPFADRLADALDRAGSPACVGLDPVVDRLPAAVREVCADAPGAIGEFCRGVLAACRGRIAAIKFQSACFERHGAAGVAVLENLVRAARAMGLVVVLDAKRGDIGLTAEHYAHAAFGGEPGQPESGADAVTVSGYLGPDTVEPFLRPGRGVFVLVRTSNPGSDAVQSARLADGRTVAEMMADHVAALGASRVGGRGLSDVGAVVGATKAADALALRRRMPDQVFLVPGYGTQGGGLEDVRRMVRPGARSPGEAGVLVTASRSIIYAFDPADRDWCAAVGAAAARFAEELRSIVPA
jgi:orotidine-5'-phosphate decarboxylase